MKKVVTTPAVDMSLRTMWEDEQRQVHAWFNHLANWDNDSFVRDNSHPLPSEPDVRVLRTTSDLRIFFSMSSDTITIVDIAKRQSILTAASTLKQPLSPESR